MQQSINITVIDPPVIPPTPPVTPPITTPPSVVTPQTPNTAIGNFLSGQTNIAGHSVSNSTLIILLVIILATSTILFLLWRKKAKSQKTYIANVDRVNHSKQTKFSKIFAVFALAILLVSAALIPNANALSNLTLDTNSIDITITKSNTDTATGSATTTTTVTTDNATGYTLSAMLDGSDSDTNTAISAGITAQLNEEILTTTAIDIWDNIESDTKEHTLSVTVPAGIATGTYTMNVVYNVADNDLGIHYLAEIVENNNITTMQGLTGALCQSATWDSVDNGVNGNNTVTLTDTRNGQKYQVRKMADNNCWMINNLKLGSTTGTTLLTPADTNISSNWTLPQVSVSTTQYYDQPIVDGPVPGSSDDINSDTFYGYLYNWCAATAGGTASGGSNTCTTQYVMPDDATQDICPANWRLPTGNTTGEFAWLNAKMNDPNATAPSTANFPSNWQPTGAFRGVFSGSRWGSSWDSQGSWGFWWSSSRYTDSGYAFYAYVHFYPSVVDPGSGANRGGRFAVRCLLQ